MAKCLFFANRSVFGTGDYEEIMNKASCLSLLSNAVLVWNTIEIDKMEMLLRLLQRAFSLLPARSTSWLIS
ncbi:MAG: transposase [Candidatus Obscuribacterales bacterium]|nr:transposase [Candidatus Obscuribacterales bacterium]